MRTAAFTLFGNLSRFCDGPSRDPFVEQIHTNLVAMLLHLNDPDVEVKKVGDLQQYFHLKIELDWFLIFIFEGREGFNEQVLQ